MAGALGLGVHVVTRQLLPVAFISATKQRGSAIRCAANTPNKRYNIAVLPGDGVGNEVIPVAVDALRLAGSLEGLDLRFEELPIGGVALDLVGVPLPEETLTKAKNSDAVLLGAVGWPKWDNNPKHLKPITALLQLRAGLEVFSNLRPITVFPQFDTILTGVMFGDILSDLAAMIPGSVGLLPSAALGDSGPGIFEPVHGSAPKHYGKDTVNPLAAVLSAAMLFRYGLKEESAARRIEIAVSDVLDRGFRTRDIHTPGTALVGCKRMGEEILRSLDARVSSSNGSGVYVQKLG